MYRRESTPTDPTHPAINCAPTSPPNLIRNHHPRPPRQQRRPAQSRPLRNIVDPRLQPLVDIDIHQQRPPRNCHWHQQRNRAVKRWGTRIRHRIVIDRGRQRRAVPLHILHRRPQRILSPAASPRQTFPQPMSSPENPETRSTNSPHQAPDPLMVLFDTNILSELARPTPAKQVERWRAAANAQLKCQAPAFPAARSRSERNGLL